MKGARPLLAAVMLLFLVFTPPAVQAQGTSTQVAITSATPDATLTTVTIYGRNFTRFPGLSVSLSGYSTPLGIVSMSDTMVLARLPAGVPPGTYWLSLQTSNPGNNDKIALAVGALGLRGSVNDLNGLACVWYYNYPSKIVVTTEPVSGAVSITCMPWPSYAVPMGTYEALPVDAGTVRAAIDLSTTSRNLLVDATCAGPITVNCTGGVAAPTQLHIDQLAVSITQANATTFTFAVDERVVTVTDIQYTMNGANCTANIDTSRGVNPSMHITGNVTFDSNPPPDPLNRLTIGVSVPAPDGPDVQLSGPPACNTLGIASIIGNYLVSQLTTIFNPHLCGAPGPTLFTPCN